MLMLGKGVTSTLIKALKGRRKMSHTYSKLYFHCVFRTKGDRLLLTADISEELNRYFVGIARRKDIFLIHN